MGENLKGFKDFYLKVKALTVLYVPYSLDSGTMVRNQILTRFDIANRLGPYMQASRGLGAVRGCGSSLNPKPSTLHPTP